MSAPFVWTETATNRLRALIEVDRLSATQASIVLSAEFGCVLTRNSCIGKGYRMKLAFGSEIRMAEERAAKSAKHKRDLDAGPKAAAERRRLAKLKAAEAKLAKKAEPMPILALVQAATAELAPTPQEYRVEIENGRSIISVKNSECKFYINSGDDPFLCCGKPVEHGRVYCSHHVSIAYYRAPKPGPKTTPREYRVVRQFADLDQ